ncbi:hypothetical protein K4B79_10045 [Streptomyces lincolnensis]|nr:hypothetical protein [Streptomyces lincolnensis]MCD7438574.1 hypothetical protein [Streptomyces lincolnensis]
MLTARSAKRTHGLGILEPARHTVPQRTPTTSVHRAHYDGSMHGTK